MNNNIEKGLKKYPDKNVGIFSVKIKDLLMNLLEATGVNQGPFAVDSNGVQCYR